jgi:hypothetical protein
MNRIATRVLAGTAAVAMISALGISAASAATATVTVKASTSPVVLSDGTSVVDGALSATANVAGTVSFTAGGAVIKGCEAVANSASGTSFVAICTPWRPAASGPIDVTATLTPTDTTIAKVTSAVVTVPVGKPVNNVVPGETISMYADTVNGSSTPTNLTSGTSSTAFNTTTGCLLLSQFSQGQQIVFRVYATDYKSGQPVAVTGQDATMNIKIAGWDTAVAMSYGNHSGTAFWAGFINTGTAGSGKFSTLGTISYKINLTMVEKPAVTKDVTNTVTKFVKVLDKKTKKAIKVNGAYVWKPVVSTVKSTVIVTPAVLGRTISYDPALWAATASQLTLSAAK